MTIHTFVTLGVDGDEPYDRTTLEGYFDSWILELNLCIHSALVDRAMLLHENLELAPEWANVTARLIELARLRWLGARLVYGTNQCSRCGQNKHMYAHCTPNKGLCFRCNGSGWEPNPQLP
jgi:hypothetical protein